MRAGAAVMSAIGSVYHTDSLSMAIDGVSVPFTNG